MLHASGRLADKLPRSPVLYTHIGGVMGMVVGSTNCVRDTAVCVSCDLAFGDLAKLHKFAARTVCIQIPHRRA